MKMFQIFPVQLQMLKLESLFLLYFIFIFIRGIVCNVMQSFTLHKNVDLKIRTENTFFFENIYHRLHNEKWRSEKNIYTQDERKGSTSEFATLFCFSFGIFTRTQATLCNIFVHKTKCRITCYVCIFIWWEIKLFRTVPELELMRNLNNKKKLRYNTHTHTVIV